MKPATAQPLPECRRNADLDKNELGKSLDSCRMRSSLCNLDLEEVSRCFARAVAHWSVCNLQMPQSACNLSVFEEDGWPSHIHDPLPMVDGLDPKRIKSF